MFVKAQYQGHAFTALHVGRRNARLYFTRSNSTVELELDHLRIECGLPPGFWADDAEIRDRRLCAWLESKYHRVSASRAPIVLSLTPSGENSFKLGPASAHGSARILPGSVTANSAAA